MATAERMFRAMGSDCHVLVLTPTADIASELADLAIERVNLLESSWSRFRPDSELSRLNARAGRGPIEVSADLFTLVDTMARAWTMSGGRFDPTVLTSMVHLGYDADFDSIRGSAATAVHVQPAPGMSGVTLNTADLTVDLPRGVGLDPGAIGKGLAADLICAEFMAAGASGVLINLGGDLGISGSADDEQWAIGIEDERRPTGDPARLLRVLEFSPAVEHVGVATSTTLKRRWAQGRRHHLIDPRTGSMSTSDLVQATVVAASAWRAEVTATAAMLMSSGDAESWLRAAEISAVLLTADREIQTVIEVPSHG